MLILPKAKRAIHVFTPALVYRLAPDHEIDVPVMAVREAKDGYETIRLFDRVRMKGQSTLEPLFDNPLPGTAGRGVAILFSQGNLEIDFRSEIQLQPISCHNNRDPQDILAEVLGRMAEFKNPNYELYQRWKRQYTPEQYKVMVQNHRRGRPC